MPYYKKRRRLQWSAVRSEKRPAMHDAKRPIGVAELAEQLGKSEKTIRDYVKQNRIPYTFDRGKLRFDTGAVRAALALNPPKRGRPRKVAWAQAPQGEPPPSLPTMDARPAVATAESQPDRPPAASIETLPEPQLAPAPDPLADPPVFEADVLATAPRRARGRPKRAEDPETRAFDQSLWVLTHEDIKIGDAAFHLGRVTGLEYEEIRRRVDMVEFEYDEAEKLGRDEGQLSSNDFKYFGKACANSKDPAIRDWYQSLKNPGKN